MFKWLRNWFKRMKMESVRNVFEYWDGEKFLRIDPWRALREIKADKYFNIELHADLVTKLGSEPETTYMAECMSRVFKVPRFDGRRGLTDQEFVDLLIDLILYFDDIQKKTAIGSMQSQPTESTSSISRERQEEPTKSSLPSFTPQSEPNYEGEPQSPTQLEQAGQPADCCH